jgi:heme oxygenase (biliverdin-IX-beta and delta-forming)
LTAGQNRTALRRDTADLHRQVETGFAALDLCRRGDYATFLLVHASVLLPLEAELEHAGAATLLADWPERRRAAALTSDLGALGLTSPELRPVPPLSTAGRMLGALYVTEGSRLGAAMILQQVLACPDPAIAAATRFLAHGRGARLWSSFLPVLEKADEPLEDMLAGARLVFGLFKRAQADHLELDAA